MALALDPDRLKTYAGFVKLEHTIFSLPVVYAGTVLGAGGWPSPALVLLVLIAAVGGRVAAMGLNRIIDVEIDRRNPRTSRRELASGTMRVREGWLVIAVGMALYVAAAWLIAPICVALAPIPVVLFALYPYLKRITPLAHVGLGLAWSMGPLGGWLAATQTLARFGEVACLWLFSVLWVAGFDIIYATMDEVFDRAEGLHSMPVWLGRRAALVVAAVLHAVAFIALIALWLTRLGASPGSLAWLAALAVVLVWQHVVAERDPEFAFFKLNAAIGFLVLGVVAGGA